MATRDRLFLVTDRTGDGPPVTHRIVSVQDHYIFDSDDRPVELIQTGRTVTGELVILQEISA